MQRGRFLFSARQGVPLRVFLAEKCATIVKMCTHILFTESVCISLSQILSYGVPVFSANFFTTSCNTHEKIWFISNNKLPVCQRMTKQHFINWHYFGLCNWTNAPNLIFFEDRQFFCETALGSEPKFGKHWSTLIAFFKFSKLKVQ